MRRLWLIVAALAALLACFAGSAPAAQGVAGGHARFSGRATAAWPRSLAATPGGAAFVDSAQISGQANFADESGGTVSPSAFTIPSWSGSFAFGGVVFPYSMAGTDPSKPPVTTTVKTAIVPLDLNFKAGVGGSLSGSERVAATLASPIFQSTDFSVLRNAYVFGTGFLGNQTGPPVTTQYGNAVQKAMFWQTGGSASGYNVLLAAPQVYPAQSIDVPANQGFDLIGRTSGQHFARASAKWMSARVHNLLVSLKIPADVVPIFLTDAVFLLDGDSCCVIGYHGATSNAGSNGKPQVNTFIYAAYSGPGIFSSPSIADVHSLSHEVSEWYADPFANNEVPPFFAAGYGCLTDLETGDPVVGSGFEATPVGGGATYHPQDEVFYSWFARETPSRGFLGRYSLLKNPNFTGPATGC